MTEQESSNLLKWLHVLHTDGDIIEIRTVAPPNLSGYFKVGTDDAALIAQLEQRAARHPEEANTYYQTLNVVNPALYSRAQHCELLPSRATYKEPKNYKSATADTDIERIQWILVDCDPERPSGISSTDEEKAAAWAKLEQVKQYLHEMGFTAPVIGDSGNGFHLLYKVDLLPDKDGKSQLIKDFVLALSGLYSDEQVKIDTTVYNASRITKLYETTARKGANTEERPHRKSKLLEIPEQIEATSATEIGWVINDYNQQHPVEAEQPKTGKQPERPSARYNKDAAQFARDFLQEHHIGYEEKENSAGIRLVLEDGCAFNPDHHFPEAYIFIGNNTGKICYHCPHDHCAGHTWHEFRELYEPDAYQDKRATIDWNSPEAKAFSDRLNADYQQHKQTVGQSDRNDQIADHLHTAVPMSTNQQVQKDNPPAKRAFKLVSFEDIPDEDPEYLFYPYIQIGKLNIVQADSNVGKTAFMCGIAALVTTGSSLLGVECNGGASNVLIISGEDDNPVLKKRVMESGGDEKHLKTVLAESDDSNEVLTFDSPELELLIAESNARLVIFDPIQLFMGAGVDMFRANETRPILARLANLAKKYHCAIVLISHMGKQRKDAILSSLGSVDITAACRSGLWIVRDPKQPVRDADRIMIHFKASNAALAQSIRYHIGEYGAVTWTDIEEYSEKDYWRDYNQEEQNANRKHFVYASEPIVSIIRQLSQENPDTNLFISFDTLTQFCNDKFGYNPYTSSKSLSTVLENVGKESQVQDGISLALPENPTTQTAAFMWQGRPASQEKKAARGVRIFAKNPPKKKLF